MKYNILLIDDDPINNFLISRLLNKFLKSINLRTAQNGEEGIRSIFEQAYKGVLPDFVFLDVNMPVMNGLEFLEVFNQLRISGKEKIKIFVVSSCENILDKQVIFQYPVSGYMTKPLTSKKLEEVLSIES
jgi:CheY-like chemotaxis protein